MSVKLSHVLLKCVARTCNGEATTKVEEILSTVSFTIWNTSSFTPYGPTSATVPDIHIILRIDIVLFLILLILLLIVIFLIVVVVRFGIVVVVIGILYFLPVRKRVFSRWRMRLSTGSDNKTILIEFDASWKRTWPWWGWKCTSRRSVLLLVICVLF